VRLLPWGDAHPEGGRQVLSPAQRILFRGIIRGSFDTLKQHLYIFLASSVICSGDALADSAADCSNTCSLSAPRLCKVLLSENSYMSDMTFTEATYSRAGVGSFCGTV
jgi:hypothetical protein